MNRRSQSIDPSPFEHGLRVLVVQKSGRLRSTLVLYLERLPCVVLAVETAEEALNAVEHQTYDLAFVDPYVGPQTGLSLGPRLLAEAPGLTVVMIAACSNPQALPPANSQGVWSHLSESFTAAQVKQIVDRAAAEKALRCRIAELEERLGDATPELKMVTLSPAMKVVTEKLEAAAQADSPVLLRGEVGTGKRLLARLLHRHSARTGEPFVIASCVGPSPEGIETELFGHAYGHSLADAQAGRVQAADGGTLLLDEVAQLSPGIQWRVLRLVQEGAFERVGEARTRRADVRIVAATTLRLDDAVGEGRFREDLFNRFKGMTIEVPPLRERREDIVPLALSFVKLFARKLHKRSPELTPAAQAALTSYRWPGNVAELRNLVERAVMLCTDTVDVGDFPEEVARGGGGAPKLGGNFTLKEIEHEHILRVTRRIESATNAAKVLGIATPTLWRRRKSMGAG
jgi:two-component system, NtrC family, response regulator AlgB